MARKFYIGAYAGHVGYDDGYPIHNFFIVRMENDNEELKRFFLFRKAYGVMEDDKVKEAISTTIDPTVYKQPVWWIDGKEIPCEQLTVFYIIGEITSLVYAYQIYVSQIPRGVKSPYIFEGAFDDIYLPNTGMQLDGRSHEHKAILEALNDYLESQKN